MNKINAQIVIGANYGDEGKGTAVNFLLNVDKEMNRPLPWIVRFNGGAQAGHTVIHNGMRRVFSSLGSGYQHGCHTYLSKFFLFNPIRFLGEYQNFVREEIRFPKEIPCTWIDPRAQIVTPWDVILNQVKEMSRDIARYGSCGHGIGATMERVEEDKICLTWGDLNKRAELFPLLDIIRERCLMHLEKIDGIIAKKVLKDIENEGFAWSPSMNFLNAIDVIKDKNLVRTATASEFARFQIGGLIFEGAQGLLLDQDNKEHQPHVTWSKTGCDNALQIIGEIQAAGRAVEVSNIFYCTRPYLTRHGNGPMHAAVNAVECSQADLGLHNFSDETNVANDWQGSLRFGRMDWVKFVERTDADFAKLKNGGANKIVLMSCNEHLETDARPYKGRIIKVDKNGNSYIPAVQSIAANT